MNNDWNAHEYCNYPAEVFPRPIRRVIRFVIIANLTIVIVGAVVFGFYEGLKVVREVGANPRSFQSQPATNTRHAHSTKGQRH